MSSKAGVGRKKKRSHKGLMTKTSERHLQRQTPKSKSRGGGQGSCCCTPRLCCTAPDGLCDAGQTQQTVQGCSRRVPGAVCATSNILELQHRHWGPNSTFYCCCFGAEAAAGTAGLLAEELGSGMHRTGAAVCLPWTGSVPHYSVRCPSRAWRKNRKKCKRGRAGI